MERTIKVSKRDQENQDHQQRLNDNLQKQQVKKLKQDDELNIPLSELIKHKEQIKSLLYSYLKRNQQIETFVQCIIRNLDQLMKIQCDNEYLIVKILQDVDMHTQDKLGVQSGINTYVIDDQNGGGLGIPAILVFPQQSGSGVLNIKSTIVTNLSGSTKTYTIITDPVSSNISLAVALSNSTSSSIINLTSVFTSLVFSVQVTGSPSSSGSSSYGDNTYSISAAALYSVSSFSAPSPITVTGTLSNGSISASINYFISK